LASVGTERGPGLVRNIIEAGDAAAAVGALRVVLTPATCVHLGGEEEETKNRPHTTLK